MNEALSGDDAADAEAADPVAAMAVGGGNGGSIIAGFVLFTVLVCAAYYVVKWKRSGGGDDRRPGGCAGVHHPGRAAVTVTRVSKLFEGQYFDTHV